VHYGGWIAPGLSLMQQSLQSHTAQLPLAERRDTPLGFGINTNDAIINGCDAAQIGAITQAIQLAKKMNSPVEKIWLDGGNAKVLGQIMAQSDIQSSASVEATEGLVLRGLWAWLLENL
jgi:type III pantothenate kinase